MKRCVLALESDKKDIYELQKAFLHAGITEPLTVVRNRDEALCYLKGVGIYADRVLFPLPRLFMVDIQAEICGGFELLEWIQHQPHLLPLITIATGREISPSMAQQAYNLGANAVFQKPGGLEELSQLIQSLEYVSSQDSRGEPTEHAEDQIKTIDEV